MSQEGDQLDDHMSEAKAKLFARLADFVDGHGNDAERGEVERLIRTNPVATKMAEEIREDSARLREVLGWTLPWHSVEPPKRDAETRKKVEALKTLVVREETKHLRRQRWRMGAIGMAAAAVVAFLILRPPPIVGEAEVLSKALTDSEVRTFVVRADQPVKANATTRIKVKLSNGSVVTLDPGASVVFDTAVMTVRHGKLHGIAGPNGFRVRLSNGLIAVAGNGRFNLQYDETGAIFKLYGADARFSGKDGERLLPAGKTVRIDRDGSVIEGPP
jgi:ferric-dicitrate binding protein FerR (iron transport regulator)